MSHPRFRVRERLGDGGVRVRVELVSLTMV
jgi:hypothetical protein